MPNIAGPMMAAGSDFLPVCKCHTTTTTAFHRHVSATTVTAQYILVVFVSQQFARFGLLPLLPCNLKDAASPRFS